MKRTICSILAVLAASTAAVYAAVDPIPCAVGNRWEYQCVKLSRGTIEYQGNAAAKMYDTSSGTAVYEVLSSDGGNVPTYTYREATNTRSTINGRGTTESSVMKLTSDSDALRILATENASEGDEQPDKQSYDPPLVYWLKGAAMGKSWDVGVIRGGET